MNLFRYPRRLLGKEALLDSTVLVPTFLLCPHCGLQHEDNMDQATQEDWSKRLHRTHLCHGCHSLFRPYNRFYTVGVNTDGFIPPVVLRYAIITEAGPFLTKVFKWIGKPFKEAKNYDTPRLTMRIVVSAYRIGGWLLLQAPIVVVRKEKEDGLESLKTSVAALEQNIRQEMSNNEVGNQDDIASGLLHELQSQNPALYHRLKAGSLTDWSNDDEQSEEEGR